MQQNLALGQSSKSRRLGIYTVQKLTERKDEFFIFADYSDHDIIALFEDIKKKADDAKAAGKTERALLEACDKAQRRLVKFDDDRVLHRNHSQWKQSKQYRDHINGFRKFINKHARNLKDIFERHQLALVSTRL